MRRCVTEVCCAALLLAYAHRVGAQEGPPAPVTLLDVPFISQSEALCGGAAAAMVLRYWGERGVDATSFTHLLDRSASGIRTGALVADLTARGWNATGVEGRAELVRAELSRGRPVLALIEDRPKVFHYLVVVAWHDRGVIFHDPARAPFRVMAVSEFERRWRAADRWMAVIVPASPPGDAAIVLDHRALTPMTPPDACESLVASGVRHAQANNLEVAERTLASAVGCPGPAAMRELAGVRLLQRRWPEVAELASAALAADAGDLHAWRLLATSRFVSGNRAGALDAWNRAGEPWVDIVRVDGLTRTRHRVVEQLLGVDAGRTLTASMLARLRRRLAELPAAASTRLDYIPAGSGLVELKAVVVERPLVPVGRLALGITALTTAATREVRLTAASVTGGGERIFAAWRFWPGRRRATLGFAAPVPRGILSVEAVSERQAFSGSTIPPAERTGAHLRLSDWASGRLQFEAGAGLDRWNEAATFGNAAGRARLTSFDDRLDASIGASVWAGGERFAMVEASGELRSSGEHRPIVLLATGAAAAALGPVPLDLWPAGDTGHARGPLMRAHPVLARGQLRVERLGRVVVSGTVEGQRWWRRAGVLHVGAAAFADLGRTSRRLDGAGHVDTDVGIGVRLAATGLPGIFRIDLAKGLRDGATALSFVYQP